MNIRHIFEKGYNIVFILCLLFLGTGEISSQVSVPSPSIYLAFDTSNPGYESVSKNSGLVSGSYQRVTDRFGAAERAVTFTGKGAGVRCAGFSINSTHTVSLWVYINNPSDIPSGAVPFASTDTKYEFYNWTDANNFILRGLGRKEATVGFNRYIPKPDGTKVPWYLWAYKPAQFNERGWYHIFVVQGAHYTRLVMYKPNSEKAYYYTWLGAQDFSSSKYLYVGGFGENYPLNDSYDDFKLYNEELIDDQIESLHAAEFPDGSYVLITNQYSDKHIVVAEPSLEDNALITQTSSVSKTQSWILQNTGQNKECKIVNPRAGKVMVVKDASTYAGAEIILFKDNNTNNGIWILEKSDSDPRYFRLKNKNSGKYLAVYQDATSDNAKLVQADLGAKTVYWRFDCAIPIQANDGIEYGLYRLKNKNSGLYLNVLNRSEEANAVLVQEKNLGDITPTNIWEIAGGVGGHYVLRNMYNQYNARIKGNNTPLEPIVQGPAGDKNESSWLLIKTGVEGEYKLRNVNNYMFAVVKDASKSEYVPVVQYESADTDNAIWILERYYYSDSPIKDGTYLVENANSGLMMVVQDAQWADNAPLIQYPSEGPNSAFEVSGFRYGYVLITHPLTYKYVQVQNKSFEEGANIVQYGTETPGTNGYWKFEKVPNSNPAKFYITNMGSGLKVAVANASTQTNAPIQQTAAIGEHAQWIIRPYTQTRSAAVTEMTGKVAGKEGGLNVQADFDNDKITAQYLSTASTVLTFRIYDVYGKLMYTEEKAVSESDNMVSLQGFKGKLIPKSLYILSITSSNGEINFSEKKVLN